MVNLMVVSARELAERERKRLEIRKTTYKAILEQFPRKLSNSAALGNHTVILTVPRFMIGFPVYDVPTATTYIQRQLDRLGYKTQRALENTIHVSWARPEPVNKVVVIDHSDEPSLASLARTAQKIRSKTKH
jgi:hypothetical protein